MISKNKIVLIIVICMIVLLSTVFYFNFVSIDDELIRFNGKPLVERDYMELKSKGWDDFIKGRKPLSVIMQDSNITVKWSDGKTGKKNQELMISEGRFSKMLGNSGHSGLYFSPQNRADYEIKSDFFTEYITRSDDKIYAIGSNMGTFNDDIFASILTISKKNGKWAVEKSMTLPGYPLDVCSFRSNEFYILSSDRLTKTNGTNYETVMSGDWHLDNINSIVFKEDDVFAGTSFGILKFDLLKKKLFMLTEN